jgi:hypothetical protein
MRNFRGIAIVLAAVTLVGCRKEIDPDYRVPPPLVERLPITVGLYYGNEFRDARVQSEPIESDFTILAGRANLSLHDHLFSDLFLKVVPLADKFKAPQSIDKLDAIIESEMSAFTYYWNVYSGSVSVDIEYSYTLYSPDGGKLNQWIAKGYGQSSKGIGVYNTLDNSIKIAMRDAAARFVVALNEDPLIVRCRERYATVSDINRKIEECFTER